MVSSRNTKILIVVVIYVGVIISIVGWNWVQRKNQINTVIDEGDSDLCLGYKNPINLTNCEDEPWCVRIYGNVCDQISIGISLLTNNSTFEYIPDTYHNMNNSWGTKYRRIVAGVCLADILNKTQIIKKGAQWIQFKADDGFSSFKLPLQVIYDYPQSVLLIHRVNRVELGSKENGGDGLIMGFVALDAISNNAEVQKIFQENGQDSVYNSVYNVKYCSSILII